MEKENEIWKDVPNYEGYYQVSDLGRVKSLSRQIWNGRIFYTSKEKILKKISDSTNYFIVGLSINGKYKSIKVHQLIAIAFLNHIPCGHKLVVDHIDNDKSNNRLSNLQLISSRENCSKDRKNGTSNYIGVNWSKQSKKWRSGIVVNKKSIRLGTFETEQEASEYYQNALKAIENGEEIKHKKKEKYSKFKCVSYCKRDKKWIAFFVLNGKTNRLGTFKTEQEAFEARCKYLENLNN